MVSPESMKGAEFSEKLAIAGISDYTHMLIPMWFYAHIMKKDSSKFQIFKPRIHDDDRRRGTFDVFHTPSGDINYSFIYPNSLVAWHRHQKQTDFWHVIYGSLKVGLFDPATKKLHWVYLHEHERQTLAIGPTIWHGYRNIAEGETVLSYYISEKYNQKDPDEQRLEVGAFGENWETEIK